MLICFKDGQFLSVKSVVTFLTRRYFRVAPSIAFVTVCALLYGCTSPGSSSLSATYSELCTTCKQYWYDNIVFTANWDPDEQVCFNSTWTVSLEVQFYLSSVIVMLVYIWHNSVGMISCIIGIILLKFYQYYNSFSVTQNIAGRGDEYLMGMILCMM